MASHIIRQRGQPLSVFFISRFILVVVTPRPRNKQPTQRGPQAVSQTVSLSLLPPPPPPQSLS